MNGKFSSSKYYASKALAEEEAANLEFKSQQNSLERPTNSSINQNKVLESMNIDLSLAKAIYEFLIGKVDRLPAIEYFSKIYNSTTNNIISMGYGVTVDKDFRITHTSPSEDSDVERNDVIKPNEYFAYYSKPGFKEENYNYPEKEYSQRIDIYLNKIFDIKRVYYLQMYLLKCKKNILSNGEEKSL